MTKKNFIDKVDKFVYVRLTKIDKNVYINHFRYNIYLDGFFTIKKIVLLTILWLIYLIINLKKQLLKFKA